jgi:hypothetical protein
MIKCYSKFKKIISGILFEAGQKQDNAIELNNTEVLRRLDFKKGRVL